MIFEPVSFFNDSYRAMLSAETLNTEQQILDVRRLVMESCPEDGEELCKMIGVL